MSRGSIQLTPMSQPDRPMRTNATLKRADSEAMRMSLPRASASPPPAAGPFTAAITGWRSRPQVRDERGDVLLARQACLGPARARRTPGAEPAPFRSSPAQNPRPAPVITITRHSRSPSTVVECDVQVFDQLVAHRVQPLGPVQRQQGDPGPHLLGEDGRHAVQPRARLTDHDGAKRRHAGRASASEPHGDGEAPRSGGVGARSPRATLTAPNHHHDHDHPDIPPPVVQEVSDGVFAYVQLDGSWGLNNTGFLVGDHGVVADRHVLHRAPQPGVRRRRRAAHGPPDPHARQHAPPRRPHARQLAPARRHDRRPPTLPRGGPVIRPHRDGVLPRRRLGPVRARAAVRHVRRPPQRLRRRPPRRAPLPRARAHHQRRRGVDPRAPGALRRRPRVQRRHAVRRDGLGGRVDRGNRPPARVRSRDDRSRPRRRSATRACSTGSRHTSASCRTPRPPGSKEGCRRSKPGCRPTSGPSPRCSTPSASSATSGAPTPSCGASPGARRWTSQAFADMVTYNGGQPMRCLA